MDFSFKKLKVNNTNISVNHKKFRKLLIIITLLFFYILISMFSYVQAVSSDLSKSVFRLHVIANSNSNEDQILKYKVRDNLLNYMNKICSKCTSKQEAIKIVTNHQNEFKQIALNTIQNEGYNYNVNLKIGNFKFPTKHYGDISLPEGYYDALKVEIGNANGRNWWCVMFPSLCFIDISSGIVPEESKEKLKNVLSDEEYCVISDNSTPEYKIKFKILELFADK